MSDARDFFDLTKSIAGKYLLYYPEIWQAVPDTGRIIKELILSLDGDFKEVEEGVFVHTRALVDAGAYLGAPCIVDAGAEIRRGAYIRGNAVIGKGAVVGNSSEVKNSILFDGVQIPHFNYAGDSILGYRAHLGAGAILSNVKADKSCVRTGKTVTPLKKLGAIVGDGAEIGCNAVIAPGAVIGRGAVVYPLSFVRGEVPADCIYKPGGITVRKIT